MPEVGNVKSACDKVSSAVGIVPFGSPRSRNQVSVGEKWALHNLRPNCGKQGVIRRDSR